MIVNQKKKKGNLNFKILKKNLFFITIFIKNFQNKIVIKFKFYKKFKFLFSFSDCRSHIISLSMFFFSHCNFFSIHVGGFSIFVSLNLIALLLSKFFAGIKGPFTIISESKPTPIPTPNK